MDNRHEYALPTLKEIEKLSPKASVLYAAMVTRMVQPLFGSGTYQPTKENIKAIDEAIRTAEEFAVIGFLPTHRDLEIPYRPEGPNDFSEDHIGYNILLAAQCALFAANAVSNHEPKIHYEVDECYNQAFQAGDLSMRAAGNRGLDVCWYLRKIYERLITYSLKEIDCLWPDNNPPDWFVQALQNNNLLQEYWKIYNLNPWGMFDIAISVRIPINGAGIGTADSQHVPLEIGNNAGIGSKSSHNNPPCLKADKIAEALADVLDNSQEAVCFGLFGRWGRGKTYLAKQVAKKLEENNYTTIEYDAWKYRTTPECWAFLYETFAKKLRTESWFIAFRVALNRNGCWPIIWILLLILLPFILPIALQRLPAYNIQLESLVAILSWLSAGIIFSYLNSVSVSLQRILSLTRHTDKLGLQAAIGKDFIALIKTWVNIQKPKRLLLIVDDLDRCESERILEIIESIQLFCREDDLRGRLQVLILLEDRTLKTQIEAKYRLLLPSLDGVDIGDTYSPRLREYRREAKRLVVENVEKIFDAHIRLDKVQEADLPNLFSGLIPPMDTDVRSKKTTSQQTDKPSEVPQQEIVPYNENGGSSPQKNVSNGPNSRQTKVQTMSVDITQDEKSMLYTLAMTAKFPDGYWTPRAVQHYTMQYKLARTIWQKVVGQSPTRDGMEQIIIEILNSRNPPIRVELPETENALLTEVVNMVTWDND